MTPLRVLLPRLLACLLLALLAAGCSSGGDTGDDRTGIPAWAGGMPVTEASELPAEARRTLQLIDDDRGARRIVTGRNGETYHTDDHYASFTAVLR
ncbi:ribonuclease domain-containing protein [Streptomyces cellulosae]